MKYIIQKEITIPQGLVNVKGDLIIPVNANGLIIFSHGSGSSRHSIRNKQVAYYLNEQNFGTLLFDLLTEEEDWDYKNRFNIDLLTSRLINTTRYIEELEISKGYNIGYFGASTGAASALLAAASLPQIGAVVSRGGRPDLAIKMLPFIKAPTLLIVGGLDTEVIQLNRQAYNKLACIKKLEIVPDASHLFEERGKMDEVSELAAGWFEKYLHHVEV
jgi:pimeloyl-ACP methyl ester carboxylesterase